MRSPRCSLPPQAGSRPSTSRRPRALCSYHHGCHGRQPVPSHPSGSLLLRRAVWPCRAAIGRGLLCSVRANPQLPLLHALERPSGCAEPVRALLHAHQQSARARARHRHERSTAKGPLASSERRGVPLQHSRAGHTSDRAARRVAGVRHARGGAGGLRRARPELHRRHGSVDRRHWQRRAARPLPNTRRQRAAAVADGGAGLVQGGLRRRVVRAGGGRVVRRRAALHSVRRAERGRLLRRVPGDAALRRLQLQPRGAQQRRQRRRAAQLRAAGSKSASSSSSSS